MSGLFIPVPLDPLVQALGRNPQTACHFRDLVTQIRHLQDRLDLELLAITLPTHDHLRYSYIVTLEGVCETRGDSHLSNVGLPECLARNVLRGNETAK